MKTAFVFLAALTLQAQDPRLALVIGNNSYTQVPALTNAVQDSRRIAAALKSSGFQVTAVANTSREALESTVDAWLDRISNNSTALVYYAGHGVEIDGGNYLLPVDIAARDAIQARNRSLSAQELLERIAARGAAIQILVLDACRDNPFPKDRTIGGARGLAPMTAASGSFIAFSTSPKQVASDNSVYAQQLAAAIQAPGLKLEEVFKRVSAQVQSASARRQVPWVTSSLAGDFYFVAAPKKPALEPDSLFWSTIKDSSNVQDFLSYTKRFPDGTYQELAKRRIASMMSAMNSDFEKGRKLFDQLSMVEASKVFSKLAKAGHARSMAYLGAVYATKDLGVAQNPTEARRWVEESVALGAPESGWAKAILLGESFGFPETTANATEAFRLAQKAAKTEDPWGMLELANLYFEGTGTKPDNTLGVQWAQRAADLGSSTAMMLLSTLYEEGRGVRKDQKTALRWCKEALDAGNIMAMVEMGLRHETGLGVRKDISEAVRLYRIAAEAGYPRGMAYFGKQLKSGEGVARDAAEGERWLKKAKEAGWEE